MNLLDGIHIILPESFWSPLVWALIHSLWQAGLAAVLLALALRLVRTHYASLRATICGVTQAGVLVAFLLTWAILAAPDHQSTQPKTIPVANTVAYRAPPEELTTPRDVNDNDPVIHLPDSPSPIRALPNWPRWIALAWIIGALFMIVRMTRDLAAGWSLARGGEIGSGRLSDEVGRLSRLLGLRRHVRLIITEKIETPATFSILRPILLFPVIPLALPPEQLEAILAHELAHIKRHDWLWHFVSRFVEAVLFYNPAIWWLGRLARREREAAADALAIDTTRQPEVFATALAEWAERAQRPKAALAWDGGGLRERVLRILKPSYQPHVRISPVGVGVALIAALLILAGLRGGAEQAVLLAQEILSPEERIERIEQAQSEIEKDEKSAKSESAERITISGQVTTADGVPLTETARGGYGVISTHQENGGGYMGTVGSNGEFSRTVYDNDEAFTFTAQWAGYAPYVIGPMLVGSREDWDDLKIVLEKGFTGQLELLDRNGNRIREARVSARLSRPARSQPIDFNNGPRDLFLLKHAIQRPYDVTVSAPGFERQQFEKVQFNPDSLTSLILTPTEPTTGVVMDENGEPLAGVPVRLIAQADKDHRFTWSLGSAPVLDTTDQRGRFTLTSLSSGMTSAVVADLEGEGIGFAVVKPGQEDVTIKLQHGRILRGEIVGDLTKLEKNFVGGHHPEYAIRMTIDYYDEISGLSENVGMSWGQPVKVTPDPDSGNPPQRGTFEIRSIQGAATLPRGAIRIEAGETTAEIPPFDGIKNVTIDLSKRIQDGRQRRDVVIEFVPPDEKYPPVKGRLRVSLASQNKRTEGRDWRQFQATVKNGRIQFRALPESCVTFNAAGLIGYWFDANDLPSIELPWHTRTRGIRVAAGDGPFEYQIDVVPAGAIRVQIKPDDLPHLNFQQLGVECRRVVFTNAKTEKLVIDRSWYSEKDGKSLITPVPFGGYQMVAELGNATRIFSEEVAVTAAKPIPNVVIDIPELTSRTVRVVDAGGKPIEGARVVISRRYPDSTVSTSNRTDAQGETIFKWLEADALDEYRVQVIGNKYRPITGEKDLRGEKTVFTIR